MSENDSSGTIVDEVLRLLGPRPDRHSIASFPRGVGWVYATVELEREVFNGGFHQYFWNTAGTLIELAIAGYDAFGCPRRAEITRRAARAASRELDRSETQDHASVQDWLLAFQESEGRSSLTPLDREWYALDQIEQVRVWRNDAIRGDPKLYATTTDSH